MSPFSNGTEFMHWQDNNCLQCSNYESKSTERSKAKCKYAFDIDFASITDGKIPLDSAEWIGLDKFGLKAKCNLFDTKFIKPIKLDLTVFKQKTLF